MFEDDIARLCQSSSDDDNADDLNVIAQGGVMIDEDGDGQDNSCLLLLEKEWQEA